MSPSPTNETLAPETVARAARRVEATLDDIQQAGGVGVAALAGSHRTTTAPAATQAATSASAPVPATRTRAPRSDKGQPRTQGKGGKQGSKGKGKGKQKKQSTAEPADPKSVTTTITLPKDVYDWYKQQAAQALFEPTTQKYMAWQLKQLMVNRQITVINLREQEVEDDALIAEAGQ